MTTHEHPEPDDRPDEHDADGADDAAQDAAEPRDGGDGEAAGTVEEREAVAKDEDDLFG